VSVAQSHEGPEEQVTDPEAFIEAVRASEGPVWALREYVEPPGEEPCFVVHYRVRADSAVFRLTERVPAHTLTGRIVGAPGTVWAWLGREVRDRLRVEGTPIPVP
jgi:hypothetical protein